MKLLPLAGTVAVIVAAASLYLSQRDDPMATPMEPSTPATAPSAEIDTTLVDVTLPPTLSETARIGERAFDAVCAACHGPNGAGRDGFGPPLVHRIYEPGHHADAAFLLAVQNGVRAHHWPFGNMPPQDGLTRADVLAITTYVRELQRANGIN